MSQTLLINNLSAIWKLLDLFKKMCIRDSGSAVMYNVVSEQTRGDDGTQTTTMYYYDAVSYTHLDVYKRQVYR